MTLPKEDHLPTPSHSTTTSHCEMPQQEPCLPIRYMCHTYYSISCPSLTTIGMGTHSIERVIFGKFFFVFCFHSLIGMFIHSNRQHPPLLCATQLHVHSCVSPLVSPPTLFIYIYLLTWTHLFEVNEYTPNMPCPQPPPCLQPKGTAM